MTDFILVCPDLKSSPPMYTLCSCASSITPGTKVFWDKKEKQIRSAVGVGWVGGVKTGNIGWLKNNLGVYW